MWVYPIAHHLHFEQWRVVAGRVSKRPTTRVLSYSDSCGDFSSG